MSGRMKSMSGGTFKKIPEYRRRYFFVSPAVFSSTAGGTFQYRWRCSTRSTRAHHLAFLSPEVFFRIAGGTPRRCRAAAAGN